MATDTRQSDEDHRRFARFRPPQAGEGGTMSLLDHIRELRYRIIVSFIAVVITSYCLDAELHASRHGHYQPA